MAALRHSERNAGSAPGSAFSEAGRAPSALEQAAGEYLTSLAVERNLAKNTLAAYRRDLAAYLAFLCERGIDEPDAVSKRDIDAFVAARRDAGYADASIVRALSAVKGLHAFMAREGLSTAHPTASVRLPKKEERLPDFISVEDARALLDQPFPATPAGARDRAELEVLYGCGLRVSELCGLDLRDLYLDDEFMRVFGSLVGDGAVSLLNYARRIMQVPVGLMGQAAAVASYPFLVSLLTNGEKERFDQTLSAALRASVGLIIPGALWMGVAAQPIMGVIFQGGRFGLAETVASTPLLQIMLAATPLWILYMVLVRAFYADGDTLTPATTGTVMTLLALPVYYWWAVPLGAWAIALTSAVSVSAYVLWLVAIWARRQGTGAFAGLLSLSGRALLCSLPAGAASWAAQYGLDGLRASGTLTLPAVAQACLTCAASGLAFAVIFLPLSYRLAPGILEPVWRRLRRGRPQGQA